MLTELDRDRDARKCNSHDALSICKKKGSCMRAIYHGRRSMVYRRYLCNERSLRVDNQRIRFLRMRCACIRRFHGRIPHIPWVRAGWTWASANSTCVTRWHHSYLATTRTRMYYLHPRTYTFTNTHAQTVYVGYDCLLMREGTSVDPWLEADSSDFLSDQLIVKVRK